MARVVRFQGPFQDYSQRRSLGLLMILVVSAVLLVTALGASGLIPESEGEEKLIGWKGESYHSGQDATVHADSAREQWVELISWEPRAFLFHNFLSPKECLYLIHTAAPAMAKSTVVDSSTGGSYSSKIRTSSGSFLMRGGDETVKRIERRISDFTHLPVDHGESIHVLHYEPGQEYQAHFDYFHDEINTKNGGQRAATVLMYLSDVEEGGETVFPAADTSPTNVQMLQPPTNASMSACARGLLAVKPRRGDALLFWNLKPDGTLDPKSLHAGCPVVRGNKWSATKWIRLHPRSGAY